MLLEQARCYENLANALEEVVRLSKSYHPRVGATIEDLDRQVMNLRQTTEYVIEFLRTSAQQQRRNLDVDGNQGRCNSDQHSTGDC
jgi:hypothetical protein